MNLLFYAPQMAAYGGMERHICTLAAAAAADGHKVRLLTTSNSLGAELRSLLAAPGIELRELSAPRGSAGSAAKLLWLARQTLAARLARWDLIYTNGQSGLASLPWKAARAGTRVIHHHHTAADEGEQRTWSPSFRKVLLKAPVLVGCSRATCAHLDRAVPGRPASLFLPYLTRCLMQAGELAEKPVQGPVTLGFLGRLVREKGIDAILRLSRHPSLRDVRWRIHGAGPAYPPESFQAYPNVDYKGAYSSADQQREALAALDAVVLLSTHNEGMPLSLIECMSAGLPWIATDRGGTRELALSAPDCLVLQPGLDDDATAAQVARFAESLRSGATSRLRQRRAYDSFLEPSRVAALWLALMLRGTAPQLP